MPRDEDDGLREMREGLFLWGAGALVGIAFWLGNVAESTSIVVVGPLLVAGATRYAQGWAKAS